MRHTLQKRAERVRKVWDCYVAINLFPIYPLYLADLPDTFVP